MELLIPLTVYGGLCFLCARFLGRDRQIGFGWSLFFCFFFSPIIGFVVTMMSPKYYDETPAPSSGKKAGGWILIALSSLSILGTLVALSSGDAEAFKGLPFAIGLIGAGIYLIGRSEGKNYNVSALTEVE